jgi:DegV family protein with EDD domain
MAAAENAARAIGDDLDVRVVDSKSITAGLGTQVLLAAQRAADGASADEVVALVEDLRTRTHVIGCLDTLENLKKGGRIGGAQAMLGSLLSIKPMIDISTGVVEEAGKHRTRKKSLEAMREKVRSAGTVEHLALMHGMAPDIGVAQALLDEDGYEYRIGHIGAVIGSHGGPRVVGACWVDAK